MPRFIVNTNAQANGDHEVHDMSQNCGHLPNPENQKDLGYHDNCHQAVTLAKQTYATANGCAYCAPDCNTG